jgi:hypothetical protein
LGIGVDAVSAALDEAICAVKVTVAIGRDEVAGGVAALSNGTRSAGLDSLVNHEAGGMVWDSKLITR